MRLYLLEESYLTFCSCKTSQLMEKGHVYKEGENLWYSDKPQCHEILEDNFKAGKLVLLNHKSSLAEDIGAATRHWKVIKSSDSPWLCPPWMRSFEVKFERHLNKEVYDGSRLHEVF